MVRRVSLLWSLVFVMAAAGTARGQTAPPSEAEGDGASPASAQPPPGGPAESPPPSGPESGSDPERLGDARAMAEEDMETEETRSPLDPYEDPEKAYMFIGASYRHTWTPEFMLNLFLDESTPTNNPGFAIEFTYRRAGLDIIVNLAWQRFGVDGPFRASGDPDVETEIIDSDLSTLMVGVSTLWSTEFNDVVALQYGIDFAIGGVIGDLHRNEAYPKGNGYEACNGAGDPDSSYCDPPPDGHYGNEPRWTDGGDVPVVWFRLGLPHLALRIKPIKQLATRIDFGFDVLSGFYVGAAAAYGI